MGTAAVQGTMLPWGMAPRRHRCANAVTVMGATVMALLCHSVTVMDVTMTAPLCQRCHHDGCHRHGTAVLTVSP